MNTHNIRHILLAETAQDKILQKILWNLLIINMPENRPFTP